MSEIQLLPIGAELSPLAQLFLLLHQTVLGPKPGPFSPPIHPTLCCSRCHSPRTRIKGLAFYPPGLGEITGFTGRCRVCGGSATYTIDLLHAEAA